MDLGAPGLGISLLGRWIIPIIRYDNPWVVVLTLFMRTLKDADRERESGCDLILLRAGA